MKSEFVSAVSHELRTPLTSISGALGLIAGGALGAFPAQVREMINIAHKNSQRLSYLINDLLDMEKLMFESREGAGSCCSQNSRTSRCAAISSPAPAGWAAAGRPD